MTLAQPKTWQSRNAIIVESGVVEATFDLLIYPNLFADDGQFGIRNISRISLTFCEDWAAPLINIAQNLLNSRTQQIIGSLCRASLERLNALRNLLLVGLEELISSDNLQTLIKEIVALFLPTAARILQSIKPFKPLPIYHR